MIPKFEGYDEQGDGELVCPACGGLNLHHEKIEIFERAEDSVTGLHVTVENLKLELDNKLDGNPSTRRHGMKIQFSCETCKAIPVLSICQHKGQTYVSFDYSTPADE